MSEKAWVMRGVDEETRAHVSAEAERRGISVAEYLSEVLLERAVVDELAAGADDEDITDAEPVAVPPTLPDNANFAVRHRLEALERRLGLSIGGLDSALHSLDSTVFGLAARVDETEAQAADTAQTLNQALHDLSGNLGALRKRLADAEDAAEAQSEAAETTQAANDERFAGIEQHLAEVNDIAAAAAAKGAQLEDAHEALQETIAHDFNNFVRETDARFVAGYADMSAASEAAVRHADEAVAHALEQLRALNESVEERLAEAAEDTRARMQAAFGDAAERLAALAERVIDNERFTLRVTDQLRAQIINVEDGAQTALEETADQLRRAYAALASSVEQQQDNTRLALDGARATLTDEIADTRDTFTNALLGVRGELTDTVTEVRTTLGNEIGEIRERQLGGLARLKLVDAAVTNTIGEVTELREAMQERTSAAAAEARQGVAEALSEWNRRYDALAARADRTEEDLIAAREALAADTHRVEECTLAALEKLAGDIASGDAALRQSLGAELAELRDQASGALARLTLIDRAIGARDVIAAIEDGGAPLSERIAKLEALAGERDLDREIAARLDRLEAIDTDQSVAALKAEVATLAHQLEAQRVDENLQQRIDDLRARLASQESAASEAADRVHGVARMLGRVTAQNADAATQQEERLHKLELALADMRLEHFATPGAADAGPGAEAVAAIGARLAALEERQNEAFESIRADIAHFIGENDRRLAALEQDGPAAALSDLNTTLEARLTALEARDVAAEFEELRRRIDERVLYVEQRSVRALEQVSETVAVIEKRLVGGEQAAARSA